MLGIQLNTFAELLAAQMTDPVHCLVLPVHAWHSPCTLGTPRECLVLPMYAWYFPCMPDHWPDACPQSIHHAPLRVWDEPARCFTYILSILAWSFPCACHHALTRGYFLGCGVPSAVVSCHQTTSTCTLPFEPAPLPCLGVAAGARKEAVEVLLVTHGPDHEFVQWLSKSS